mmetsp:Transcript_14618/g.25726  ORF Transcript_14618/g.25726 Transcript_14618/m.25726 type:complete len:260 (+) Transcript_14618:251-1030(+)
MELTGGGGGKPPASFSSSIPPFICSCSRRANSSSWLVPRWYDDGPPIPPPPPPQPPPLLPLPPPYPPLPPPLPPLARSSASCRLRAKASSALSDHASDGARIPVGCTVADAGTGFEAAAAAVAAIEAADGTMKDEGDTVDDDDGSADAAATAAAGFSTVSAGAAGSWKGVAVDTTAGALCPLCPSEPPPIAIAPLLVPPPVASVVSASAWVCGTGEWPHCTKTRLASGRMHTATGWRLHMTERSVSMQPGSDTCVRHTE